MSIRYREAVCFWMLIAMGCNRVAVVDPPLPAVPTEAARIVTSKYPDATDLVATPLIMQKIWEIGFRIRNSPYLSVVSTTEELASLRWLDEPAPDSLSALLTGLGFGNGTLTNFRQERYAEQSTSQQYAADFDWNGGSYTVYWTLEQLGLREKHISITPRSRFRYFSNKSDELADPVKSALKGIYIPSGTATAVYADSQQPRIFVVGDAPSHFGLSAFMIIDSHGKMLYSKMGKQEAIENDKLPESVQIHLRTKVAPSLTIWGGTWQAFRFEDKGFSGLKAILRQPPGYPVAEAYLYFDSEGNLQWEHYYGRTR